VNKISNPNRITTAVLLAAGTGTRLLPLTKNAPKCLTIVAGQAILGRLIDNLRIQSISRLVVVIGHLGEQIREYLQQHASDMQVDYVSNPIYQTTNNIYSLWLAKKQIHEAFLLLESDLVFNASMLDEMMVPDKIALSKMLPWMNGTTVELDTNGQVSRFLNGHQNNNEPHYKTVNIYSLSELTWHRVLKKMSHYIATDRLGEYYENVFTEMVNERSLLLSSVFFDANGWYEIDDLPDLNEAEKMFAACRNDTMSKIMQPLQTTDCA
jgi:choline kinase